MNTNKAMIASAFGNFKMKFCLKRIKTDDKNIHPNSMYGLVNIPMQDSVITVSLIETLYFIIKNVCFSGQMTHAFINVFNISY